MTFWTVTGSLRPRKLVVLSKRRGIGEIWRTDHFGNMAVTTLLTLSLRGLTKDRNMAKTARINCIRQTRLAIKSASLMNAIFAHYAHFSHI